MKITSPSFTENGYIPSKFTCDGSSPAHGLSPELEIVDIPPKTKTLALIMDDPDSPTGTWVHWVHFNIPVAGSSIKINQGTSPIGIFGQNTWGKLGYSGPCPGQGVHRYIFKIYALDLALTLFEGATKDDLLREMHGHIVEESELTGRYERVS